MQWTEEARCEGAYGSAQVSRWRSSCGLRLVHADVPGPLVYTHFYLATETDSDDGLPHTLEHLVFLGSEDYPYKGILDVYANRCYASGTNAVTENDHTAYTLQTAGSKGTLAMLPVYLDHILYPLLTEQSFVTEVHHVNGEGEDAGVVYSEMLGFENNASNRCNYTLMKALYPNSGYSSETGGLLQNLRTSTTNEKVKKFHAEYYRPENITIVVTGQIDKEDIFKALQPMEEKIINKNNTNPLPTYVRPWQSPIAPLEETKILREKYPTDSEDCGNVIVAWRGPKVLEYEGVYECTASSILLRYLCKTAVAPLQKELVEIENPYASNVSLYIYENYIAAFVIKLEDVPVPRLNDALPKLLSIISSMTTSSNTLELNRIHMIIDKEIREILAAIENTPHDVIAFNSITDMLYSTDKEGFKLRLNNRGILDKLMGETREWWEKLFKKYFDKPHIAVIGEPSIDLMVKMAEDERERVEQQKTALGEDGLKEKGNILLEAQNHNKRKVPLSVITAVGVDNCDDIQRFSMESWTTESAECPYFNVKNLPFYARIHHTDSQLVYIRLLMNTCVLTAEERKYLPLLIEVITQTSFDRNHRKMEYNTLVEDIQLLTNFLSLNIGITNSPRFKPNNFHNTVSVYTQCAPDKYEQVVDLLWHVLNKTHFERQRVMIVAQKMINNISSTRRNGDSMVTRLLQDLIYEKESNIHTCSILRQYKLLNEIMQILEKNDNGCHEFLNKLDSIRKKLVNEQNIWLHFVADLKKNNYSTDPWNVFKSNETNSTEPIVKCAISTNDHQLLVDTSERQGQGCIVGMGTNSIYLEQYSPGPLSYTHPDLPALYVTLQYFTQQEGQLWNTIRGGGFAYGFSMFTKPLEGLILFSLSEVTNIIQCYEKTKNIIDTFLNSETWDDNQFTSAKSSLIYEIYDEESSPGKLIQKSLKEYFRGVDENFTKTFVKAIVDVTQSDAMKIAKKWLPGIFDASLSTISIVCNTSKIDEIKQSFNTLGYSNLKAYKTFEDSHLGVDK